MEKSKYTKEPPSWWVYEDLRPPNQISTIVNEVGGAFTVGTVAGFFYHFIKSNSGQHLRLRLRLRSALCNSPRLGGFCALINFAAGVPLYANYELRGATGREDIKHVIAATTVVTALAFAPRGFPSASSFALLSAGLSSLIVFDSLHHTRFDSSICNTNTYAYPHYRHRPYY